MAYRRNSPPINNEYSSTAPTLTRSRASSSSTASVSSINSLNGLLSSPTTTTAAASISESPTAVLASGTTTSPAATSSTYYPGFPYRNKSRTPSVSSTSTIREPIHSLLQTNGSGILLPKRHAAPVSAAATLSTASATAGLVNVSFTTPSSSPTTNTKHYTMAAGGITNHSNGSTSSINTDATAGNSRNTASAHPILVLESINDSFALKSLELPENTRVKIGRQTGVTTAPHPSNGYFDSKVLSRVHAEVWSENGKIYIRDVKSSNGTFLNGKRLGPESVESEAFVLNQNDRLEFGIDIMDENGSLLHEKVACKIYISRMSYPTPGGSPQESPTKLRSGSPVGSGSSSVKSNSGPASAGQSTNIDLIISRLQNELTRSQETNADLGALKQGLGELERAIVTSNQEESKPSSNSSPEQSTALIQATSAVDHTKILEEVKQAHAAELAKVNKVLEETQAELDAYVQKIQLLEPLVAEDEILRRDIAQSTADLTKIRLERDMTKDSMNELINEHQQAMESLRKEQEAAMTVLEAAHKDNMERVAREAAAAQELLILKHQEDLAMALDSTKNAQIEAAKAEEAAALQAVTKSLKTEVGALRETVEKQDKQIQELASNKDTLTNELADAKAVVVKAEKELKEAKRQQKVAQEELSVLTSSSKSLVCKHPACPSNGHAQLSTTNNSTTKTSRGSSKDLITRQEFSWAQFVFKRNAAQFQQVIVIL
ncbi:hypothetical protein EDD11_008643 [Mortierella claussenii]|nr:hypothetical protein EDD11_008643 [Mortierella claussenii]